MFWKQEYSAEFSERPDTCNGWKVREIDEEEKMQALELVILKYS